MKRYFQEHNYNHFESIYKEFESMRRNVLEYLWKETEPDIQLSQHQIVDLSKKYLEENYPWINKQGIKSVNNYLLWMCWHEGLLIK